VTQDEDATAAAVTVADGSGELWRELLGKVAGCFPRRETRQNVADTVGGLLMELKIATAGRSLRRPGTAVRTGCNICCPGQCGMTSRFLSGAAAWAAGRLDDGEAVLIVDETADAKPSADAAGAARQYSGTLRGIALCQVAVTLTYATAAIMP